MTWTALRLAEHDPLKADAILERLTLTQIAEAHAVKYLDNWVDLDG